jgi:hypothetical protein
MEWGFGPDIRVRDEKIKTFPNFPEPERPEVS